MALLLCVAGLRGACAPRAPDGEALVEWAAERPPPLPSLAEDGVERLAWLPGVGAGRARRIVAGRPLLGQALRPELLPLLPGVGPRTAEAVDGWLRTRQEEADAAALE